MQADLIINPHARLLRRDPSLIEALQQAAAGRAHVHITRSLAELDTLCAQLFDDTRLVLLAGGDGSLMAGVSALSRRADGRPLPAIAPISVGTAGTVARNWGLHGHPLKLLRGLLHGSRRLVMRPSLQLNVEDEDSDNILVGFIFGTGLVARFIELYNSRGAPGYAGAAKLVAQIFAESFYGGALARRVLSPLPCRLETDGEQHLPTAWSLICASVVDNLGIGMRLTYRAGEDVGRPHLVASSLLPRALGRQAPRVLAGTPLSGQHHVDRLTHRFTVTFEESGPFVLDGELLQARRVEVSAGPLLSVAMPG